MNKKESKKYRMKYNYGSIKLLTKSVFVTILQYLFLLIYNNPYRHITL